MGNQVWARVSNFQFLSGITIIHLSKLYARLPQKHYLKNYIQSPACSFTHFPLFPEYFIIFFSSLFLNNSSLSTLVPKTPQFCHDITDTYGLCNNPAGLTAQHPSYQITQNIKHNKMKINQNQRKSKHSQDLSCGEFYKH